MLADSNHSILEYWLNNQPLWPYLYSNIRLLKFFHDSNIGWIIENADHTFIPVLDHLLVYSKHSPFKYSWNDRLLRIFPDVNIGCHVSRLKALTIWILVESSAILTIPIFKYWITGWPTLRTHHLNIHWMVGYSDYSMILILNAMLANSSEYWLNHWSTQLYPYPNIWSLINIPDTHAIWIFLEYRLLRLLHDLNVSCHVSRIKVLIIWVLVESLVTLTISVLLVSVLDTFTISGRIGYSADSLISIFNAMLAN
jgi:hypothetical protein